MITYFSNRLAEYKCDGLYTKLFMRHAQKTKIGLRPNSAEELISYNSGPKFIPCSTIGPTEEAICIIHGTAGDPNQMKKITAYFENDTDNPRDIYLPLLKFHRRRSEIISKFNFVEIAAQLEDDIKYIALKYKKIYCIGHSLGAMLLFYLSSAGRLPKNIYMVLYAPPIDTNISLPMYYISSYAIYLNAYSLIPPYYNDINTTKKHNLMDYFMSWSFITVLYDASFMLKKMIGKGLVPLNYYTYILCEYDAKVPLFTNQAIFNELMKHKKNKCIGGSVLYKSCHTPHLQNNDVREQLLVLLKNHIEQLSDN